MTILLLAGVAIAAITAFKRTPEGVHAAQGETALGGMRREVSVLFELAKAAWMLIEALLFITGIRQATPTAPVTPAKGHQSPPTTAKSPPPNVPFGGTVADDVPAGT
jgi:hypothetical protein